MGTSIFLAKLLEPYCIIVAVGILFNLKTYRRVMEDFLKNAALIYLGGILALIVGLLIVLSHNVWTASWVVIITIFGWLGIIKGAWLIIFPNAVGKFTKAYQKSSRLLVVHLILVLALGIYLSVLGYWLG